MIDVSLQAETLPAYHLRGLDLFELYRNNILASYPGAGRWPVPSGTTPGVAYEVRVSLTRPERATVASAPAFSSMAIAATT